MNMPIFRAKTKSKDGYIEGLVSPDGNFIIVEIKVKKAISQIVITEAYEIDPTTLAIHFPDMLDSQGNKIFASLQEDGKGGCIAEYNGRQEIIKYSNGTIQSYMFRFEDLKELNFKAIGIQE